MSPNQIEYLLQLYYRTDTPRQVDERGNVVPFNIHAVRQTESLGLVFGHELTERGLMYVRALTYVPLPIPVLAMPAPYPTPTDPS